jgi:hypothetical protein
MWNDFSIDNPNAHRLMFGCAEFSVYLPKIIPVTADLAQRLSELA